ncbi:stage II sporulation protein P [Sutcliffiella sp. NC1]|uniref:stage II sporulation protein P n=1 Tax=Sutcliffiella sp. NC1 TaxID=3004096 RepID=UPI0022DD95FC|nr:stage II sporulation protein P [Sutcliffiella sp. NC1]WBL16608.1 stage II sporulation protein P [Sutcliffiella sp. NC1]
MQNDNNLFKLMNEVYPQNPSEEFVDNTREKLKLTARGLDRKRKLKRVSIISSTFLFFTVAATWIFFFGGSTVISNTLQSISSDKTLPLVDENEQPSVYIYHTHNSESFSPEIQVDDISLAYHEEINITLLGKRLSDALLERNIKSVHDTTDVAAILKQRGLTYNEAYTISREALQNTLKQNNNIEMIFDLHRDSQDRKVTTVEIDGVKYARVMFTLSNGHIHYEQNLEFADIIHHLLEEKYPGISRGTFIIRGPNQNTYNQDLKENSLLIEIGGVENTLEESYRTVDILADVIKEVQEMTSE